MKTDKQIFEKNISLLKNFPMGIYIDTLTWEFSEKTQIFSTKSGDISAYYAGKLLHSQYDPVAEGKQFPLNLSLKKGDHVLLYGFSLGYHIEPLLELIGENGSLLIIELNSEIFSAALQLKNFSSLLSKKNIYIICGGNEKEVSGFFRQSVARWEEIPDERKKIAIYTPSYNSIPQGFDHIKNAFELFRMEKRFDTVLGKQNRSNTEQNQTFVKNAESTTSMFGKFKDKSGYLIGSGPSLDNILRNLKYIPKESVVIAVDSALTALLGNNIQVDFVISIDPQDGAYSHMEESLRSNVPLIFMPQTNPYVLQHHKGEKYVVFKEKSEYAETNRGDNFSPEKRARHVEGTQSGGAVSCVGLDMLIKFGANPIILAGLDSAFPWGRYYSNEVTEGKAMMNLIEKNRVNRQIHQERILSDETINAPNCFKTQVSTHRNLFSYLRATEELLALHKDISFILWGSHGASITGSKESSGCMAFQRTQQHPA